MPEAASGLANGVSVVIPVYNSELSLQPLIESLIPALKALGLLYEIILVDDGSSDQSWQIVDMLSAEHDSVYGIQLMRNFGQHNALLCGIRQAKYDKTITMDDDMQHPPEKIASLLATLAEGYNVVYGSPEQEKHGLMRDMASRITKLVLQRAMGADTARQISAFRAFETNIRDSFAAYDNTFASLDVLLTWGALKFKAIPVKHAERTLGQSNYTVGKLVIHALNMMTGFSVLPLQFASLIGFGFTIFGLLALAFVLIRYIAAGMVVPGFAFLASIIIIFSGAQLFALGIMGEYIARIHSGIIKRPTYVVGKTT